MVYASFDKSIEQIIFQYDTNILNHLSVRNLSIGSNSLYNLVDIYNTSNIYRHARISMKQYNSNHDVGIYFENTTNSNANLFIGVDVSRSNQSFIKTSNCDFYIKIGNIETLRFAKNGNIGIGTTLPKQALDIHNNVYFNNSIGIGTTLPRNRIDVQDGNVNINGNLGIGTTIPRHKLDIQGGNMILSGNLGIGTSNALYNLYVLGETVLQGNLTLVNGTDTTKKITFNTSSIDAGQTYSYSFPSKTTSLIGGSFARLSTQLTVNGTTPEYPNLSASLTAGTYQFKYHLIYQTPNLLDGIAIAVEYTGTASSLIYTTRVSSSDTTTTSKVFTASGGTLTTTSVDAENINYPISIVGSIIVTTSGTLRVSVSSNRAAGSVSIMPGSLGEFYVA